MRPTIALVEHDLALLPRMQQALQQAGFAVAAFTDSLLAWDHLKGGDTDALIARVETSPERPSVVALSLGGRYANPDLQVVLLASQQEMDSLLGLGDVLPASLSPDDVAAHVMRMVSRRPRTMLASSLR